MIYRRIRRRRGEASFPSSQRLPPARRFSSVDDSSGLPEVLRGLSGAWGEAPYLPRPSSVQIFSPPARSTPPPYRAPFSAFDYWSRSPRIRIPWKVRFCVQRKQRREVLFAMKRAGFRGSAPKRHYRRTQNSQYRC